MPKYLNPLFSALGDATRRDVVERLAQGPATVSALAGNYDMSLPAFTQHLGVLEKAGLIASHKEGRVRTCYLQDEALASVEDWVTQTRQYWEGRVDALAAYAEAQHEAEQVSARRQDEPSEGPHEGTPT